MTTKTISAILVIILIALVSLNLSLLRRQKTAPKPTPPPLPSLAPATAGPRIMPSPGSPEKIEYSQAKIEIRNFTPIPNTLTVKAPTIVTWTNFDKDPHQIVGDKWKSRSLKEKDSFSQAFEKPGNYYYKDPQSPQLQGLIIVE